MGIKNMGVEGQDNYGFLQNSMESKFQFCIRKNLLCWNKDRRCNRRGADSNQMLPVCAVVNPSDLTGFMAAHQRNEIAYLSRSTKGLVRGEVFSKGLF